MSNSGSIASYSVVIPSISPFSPSPITCTVSSSSVCSSFFGSCFGRESGFLSFTAFLVVRLGFFSLEACCACSSGSCNASCVLAVGSASFASSSDSPVSTLSVGSSAAFSSFSLGFITLNPAALKRRLLTASPTPSAEGMGAYAFSSSASSTALKTSNSRLDCAMLSSRAPSGKIL